MLIIMIRTITMIILMMMMVILTMMMAMMMVMVRGAVQTFFWANLGFCPNRLDPPPPPRTLGHQQLKKNFDVYFAF